MRKKVYTKEHILNAAYEVVLKDGFHGFTARNVAKQMGISTQPIYLEFENMADLKGALLDKIYNHLFYEVFTKEITGDTLIDLGLSYINFAKEQPKLFSALFIEEYGGGKRIHDFSFDYFKNLIHEHPKYHSLKDDAISALHIGSWITVTGFATLAASGIMHPSQEEITRILLSSYENILKSEATPILSTL